MKRKNIRQGSPRFWRRGLSLLVALAVFLPALGGLSGIWAGATVSKNETLPTNVIFQVPETVWLAGVNDTAETDTIVNYSNWGTTGVQASNAGKVYFACAGTTGNVTITCSDLSGVGSLSGAATGYTGTIPAGAASNVSTSPNEGALCEWKATYTYNGVACESYAYSWVYQISNKVAGAAGQSWATWSNYYVTGAIFAARGFHEVGANPSTNTNGLDGQVTSAAAAKHPTNWLLGDISSGTAGYAGYHDIYEVGELYLSTTKGATVVPSGAGVVHAIAGTGSGMRNTYFQVSGGWGKITVDTSRFSNLNQIPGLKLMLAVCRMHKSNDTSYHTCKANETGMIRWPEGTDIAPSTGFKTNGLGVKYNAPFDLASTAGSKTYNGRWAFDCGGGDWVGLDLLFAVQPTAVDKAPIRTAIANAMKIPYSYGGGSLVADQTAYLSQLKAAYEKLGNPKDASESASIAAAALADLTVTEKYYLNGTQTAEGDINFVTAPVHQATVKRGGSVTATRDQIYGYDYEYMTIKEGTGAAVRQGTYNTTATKSNVQGNIEICYYYQPIRYKIHYNDAAAQSNITLPSAAGTYAAFGSSFDFHNGYANSTLVNQNWLQAPGRVFKYFSPNRASQWTDDGIGYTQAGGIWTYGSPVLNYALMSKFYTYSGGGYTTVSSTKDAAAPKDYATGNVQPAERHIWVEGSWVGGVPYTVAYNKGSAAGASGSDLTGSSATMPGWGGTFGETSPATTIALNGSTTQFTRPGHSYAQWAVNADGSGTAWATGTAPALSAVLNTQTDAVKYPATTAAQTIYLYPVWTLNTYKIVYNNNTGAGAIADGSFQYGAANYTVAVDTNMSKTGYHFVGWSTTAGTDGAGGAVLCGASAAMTGTALYSALAAEQKGNGGILTLYACWEINSYQVRFLDPRTTPTATEIANHTYSHGQSLSAWSDIPTSFGGAAIMGWYKDAALTQAVTLASHIVPTDGLSVYAKFASISAPTLDLLAQQYQQRVGSGSSENTEQMYALASDTKAAVNA
ncbi:MAG: InlB B-repeat-containing protein, partial [Oscillospiraceae bacterium]|nr:InlB B-repeat-containing protein [Oscillospiraceae bacterium]